MAFVKVVNPTEPADVLLVEDQGVGFIVQAPSQEEIFISDDMISYLHGAMISRNKDAQ